MPLERIKELGRGHFQTQAAALRLDVRMVIDGALTEWLRGAGSSRSTRRPTKSSPVFHYGIPKKSIAPSGRRSAFHEGAWSPMEPRKRPELALLDTLGVGKPIVDALTGDVP